jgi:vancomycin resistance protein YoaR
MSAEEIDLVDAILGPAAAARWETTRSDAPESDAPESTAPEAAESTVSDALESNGLYAPDVPESTVPEPTAPEPWVPEAAEAIAPESIAPESTVASVAEPAPDEPEWQLDLLPRPQLEVRDKSWPRFRLPSRPRVHFGRPHVNRLAGFALAFILGALATVAILAAAIIGVTGAYSNRVVPGVHVGAVYLSGLSRDQVVARLATAYAYLGQGDVVVTTPTGSITLTYQQLGRGPDVQFMADAAMSIGHTGYPIADAVTMLRTASGSENVPIVARIDPTAVATSVNQLAAHDTLPLDARAWTEGSTFTYSNSSVGQGIDEKAISAAIVDRLSRSDAPATFPAGGAFVKLEPRVTDADAQAAIGAAQRMAVNVKLEFGGSSPTPGSSDAAVPPTTFVIASETVRGWIVFQTGSDGRYGPAIDQSRAESYLSGLTGQFQIAPVEPTIVFDSAGKPLTAEGGQDGKTIDPAATARLITAYLDRLSVGGTQALAITVATKPVPPYLTVMGPSSLVEIGQWQTTFYPDVSNGFGANIRTPAKLLNGKIILPGQRFSFLDAVSPIDEAHGYTMGGVIMQGKSDHTGAMGGGICSASTTMFNAAARAGLQIDERHPHYYYINRYPVGLDATVLISGDQTWDLQWTNDTPNPILIVTNSTYGSASIVTMQLWSLPLDRKVTFSPEFKANVVPAGDYTVYSTSLPVGQTSRSEYPTDGFDTSRTRTVTDSFGKVIHSDTWNSHYSMVNGLLVVGAAPAQAPLPLPGAPQPAVLPAPVAPVIASRRSSVRRPRSLSR